MKYDFTIHSMQPSITLLFGLNNLKIRNINVKVVDNQVELTLDGSASISNHDQSFDSNNTLSTSIVQKYKTAVLKSPLPAITIVRTNTAPVEFEGFSPKEMNCINAWLHNILNIEKNDSLTA